MLLATLIHLALLAESTSLCLCLAGVAWPQLRCYGNVRRSYTMQLGPGQAAVQLPDRQAAELGLTKMGWVHSAGWTAENISATPASCLASVLPSWPAAVRASSDALQASLAYALAACSALSRHPALQHCCPSP